MPALGTAAPSAEVETHWKPGIVKLRSVESASAAWLLCDGSFKPQASYPTLFGKVQHSYNRVGGVATDPGNGTFRVPDLRQAVPRGVPAAGNAQLGVKGGSIDHTHGVSQLGLPDHSHGAGSMVGASHGHGAGGVLGEHGHAVVLSMYTPRWQSNADEVLDLYNYGYTSVIEVFQQAISIAVNNGGITLGGQGGSVTGVGGYSGQSGSANPPYQAVAFFVKT